MYTKDNNNIFSRGNRTFFYKNDRLIACRDNGEKIHILWTEYEYMWAHLFDAYKYNTYRQACGWRYWRKHFPNRSYYSLPAEIVELLDLECDTFGTYVNKTGELIAYEA